MSKQAIAVVLGGLVLFAVGLSASFGLIDDESSGGPGQTAPAGETTGVMTMPGGETMTGPMETTPAGTMPATTMPATTMGEEGSTTGGVMTMPDGQTMTGPMETAPAETMPATTMPESMPGMTMDGG